MKEFVLEGGAVPNVKIDYEGELNAEQLPVVQHGDGPTLVLAGAGSGKTRTITYRVAWLLEHGVAPDRIMLLTFTNKAAKEMIVRIEALLKSYPHGVWAGTFHSVANRLLRKYGKSTGYGHNFTILDEEDANDLMKLCIKELKIDTKAKRFPSPGVMRGIRSYCVNSRRPLAEVIEERHEHFLPLQGEIEAVIARFAAAKLEQQSMDFDDLLVVLLELLQNNAEVRASLAQQFEYVLVDEFQDTNVIQADIVDALSSVHRNVLVVGDDAQSIYSFRAAQIKNILEFPTRYPGAKMFRLVTNYRSTPEILDVANAVIANNADQFKKDLVAVVKHGEKPYLVPAADGPQEAQYVVEQILELNEGMPLRQMAVLFRAAFHSQALEFELMKRGILY
ncbi:MAG: ATP-dependent helicase, partial [Candidatus Uhrbacteria bacterium]|nr:ATP-dependent helicase [Candidatus Uhrbacteria bacterium]